MKSGVGNHCGLFLCANGTCNWIEMHGHQLLGILYLTAFVRAQQYGPVPSRPQQFAGATLIQQARPNFRQRLAPPRAIPETIPSVNQVQMTQLRRLQPVRKAKAQLIQSQIVDQQGINVIDDVPAPFNNKIVTPTALPQFQIQTSKLTPRPVDEEVNEDEEIPTTIVTTPSTTYTVPIRTSYPPAPAPASASVSTSLQSNQIPSGFQRPQFIQPNAFRPVLPQQVQPVQFAAPALQGRQLVRQQLRPAQGLQASVSRQVIPQSLASQIPPNSQPAPEEDQYFRQVQSRPLKKQEPVRQQVIERDPIRQPEVIRQQPARTQLDYSRPTQRESHVKASQNERKPVAQTIRKYHEEHEDGSITWGYENDDGSFKEETIGIDCVTRGKYGYFDPDGVKREYTYQTGIPCDKTQESSTASNQGFIDYTNNKYVLPNGDEIDLEAMVKNRARKPVSRYSNRA